MHLCSGIWVHRGGTAESGEVRRKPSLAPQCNVHSLRWARGPTLELTSQRPGLELQVVLTSEARGLHLKLCPNRCLVVSGDVPLPIEQIPPPCQEIQVPSLEAQAQPIPSLLSLFLGWGGKGTTLSPSSGVQLLGHIHSAWAQRGCSENSRHLLDQECEVRSKER